MKTKNKIFTGKCICGHSWDDHHLSAVCNSQALDKNGLGYKNVNGWLGEECEATQFEGEFCSEVITYLPNGQVIREHFEKMCNCRQYFDVGWVKRSKQYKKNIKENNK